MTLRTWSGMRTASARAIAPPNDQPIRLAVRPVATLDIGQALFQSSHQIVARADVESFVPGIGRVTTIGQVSDASAQVLASLAIRPGRTSNGMTVAAGCTAVTKAN